MSACKASMTLAGSGRSWVVRKTSFSPKPEMRNTFRRLYKRAKKESRVDSESAEKRRKFTRCRQQENTLGKSFFDEFFKFTGCNSFCLTGALRKVETLTQQPYWI
jgi:hypothetical protein